MRPGHIVKWTGPALTPSPLLAAGASIIWTALWLLVGKIGIGESKEFGYFALLMLGVALLYGIRAWLTSQRVFQVASVLVQIVLVLGIGIVLQDVIFPVALLFALMGEMLYLHGLALVSLITLLASFVGMIALQMVLAGDRYLLVFVIASVLLSPLPLLLGVRFTLARQAQQQHVYQERLHTLMLEHQQVQVLGHERQRMARDLHDTLAQGVAGIILQLEATKPHLAANDGEKVQQIIERTLLRARATLQEARAVIADLRVATSLRQRVNEKIEQFHQLTAIPCEVSQQDLECDDPRVTEIILYTLVEGLANIAQHAHASRVIIAIIQSKQAVTLRIQDNGWGFDPQKVPAPGHYGLLGIRERIHLIRGQISLESALGQGTCLQVHLPLEEMA